MTKLKYEKDYALTLAQSMLYAMGLRGELLFAHIKEPNVSYTKKGPGRKPAHKR